MRNKIKINPTLIPTPRNFLNIPAVGLNLKNNEKKLPEILIITPFPPRQSEMATYSQELVFALHNKFDTSFKLRIAALEVGNEQQTYAEELYTVLATDSSNSYVKLALKINNDPAIELVLIQYEFDLFKGNEDDFILFVTSIHKPLVIAFHKVLPSPTDKLKKLVQEINTAVASFVVMTHSTSKILQNDYDIVQNKITVIPDGTYLENQVNKKSFKAKYNLSDKKIISNFGSLNSVKSIETCLEALQLIITEQPDVLLLIIGKTNLENFKNGGEKCRNSLENRIATLNLQNYVKIKNLYVPLEDLLEYYQLIDIHLYTSKNKNKAVTGILESAVEVVQHGMRITTDFESPQQLAEDVMQLLKEDQLRRNITARNIHKQVTTAWKNAAIAHALLFESKIMRTTTLQSSIPNINLKHLKNLTTSFGMIQFSIVNNPDLNSGYTIDDNAGALVAMCQHYELTQDKTDLEYIKRYFNFIKFCYQSDGTFLNYVNNKKRFTKQNNENLDDANGKTIWALGYLISLDAILPTKLYEDAVLTMKLGLKNVHKIPSPRALAFIIKGIYYSNLKHKSIQNVLLMQHLADKLAQMFHHESKEDWPWFEDYLTYKNSILPEAMLCAYLSTGVNSYKNIAKKSFDFLLSKIFTNNNFKEIANKGSHHRSEEMNIEKMKALQPIDAAYIILALSQFYNTFQEENYILKMKLRFNWFLGDNHLHQSLYSPLTGGCNDGLEENHVKLNQGAESTVSYLMARLTIEKHVMEKVSKTKEKMNMFKKSNLRVSNKTVSVESKKEGII